MIIFSCSDYFILSNSLYNKRITNAREKITMQATTRKTTVWLCTTAMLMALNIALSSFGVPVPGGHLYLNDIVICAAALLLDPVGALVGAVIMVVGYSLGRAFIYATPEAALLKLPYQILQAAVGALVGTLLVWKCGLRKLFNEKLMK